MSMTNRDRAVYFLTLSGFGLLLVSLVLPVYSLTDGDVWYYWSSGSAINGSFLFVNSLSSPYAPPQIVMLAMTLIGLASSFFVLVAARKDARNVHSMRADGALVLAALSSFASPVTFELMWPTWGGGFFGSSGDFTWGASYGWFLQFVSFAMFLPAAFIAVSGSRGPR